MPTPTSRRLFLVGLAATGLAACTGGGGDATTADGSPTTAGTTGGPTTAGTVKGPATSAPVTTVATSSSSSSTTKGEPTTSRASSTTTAPASPAGFVTNGAATDDRVALTFHTNGDLGLAQRLLDVFADHDAVMTSFVIGNWIEANPSWARKLLDGGHELANHTYTHPDFASLSPAAMATEITKCRDVLARLSGDGGRFFRPSGTDDGMATPSKAILQAAGDAGYPMVAGWDIEPFDYRDPGATLVQQRVIDGLHGGGVVSLHFGHAGTVEALPAILDAVAAKGLRTARLSDLIGG